MCTRVTCPICGLATWNGCGDHVEQALRGVPPEDRCQGHDQRTANESAPQQSRG